MANIKENLKTVTAQLPEGVQLVAVSKFHPVEELAEAYEAGQRLFGENRVQELVAKAPQLPEDIRWHFIGHLQKNKVRALMPHVSVIESVDRQEQKNAGTANLHNVNNFHSSNFAEAKIQHEQAKC